jgi:hypothetical protein
MVSEFQSFRVSEILGFNLTLKSQGMNAKR